MMQTHCKLGSYLGCITSLSLDLGGKRDSANMNLMLLAVL